jgi:hypothetical protein
MMEQVKTSGNGYQSRLAAGTMRLFWWASAWVAATAVMRFGPKYFWNGTMLLTAFGVALDVAIGIGLILAHKSYLANLDELQRKVYLEAFGITAGVAVVAGVPLSLLDSLGLISFHVEIWHLIIVMSLTYVASIVYGTWRFR